MGGGGWLKTPDGQPRSGRTRPRSLSVHCFYPHDKAFLPVSLHSGSSASCFHWDGDFILTMQRGTIKTRAENLDSPLLLFKGFPGGSGVKNLPTSAGDLQEMWVQSLGQEGALEKEVATHSSVLDWEIPNPTVGYSPWGYKRVRHNLEKNNNNSFSSC